MHDIQGCQEKHPEITVVGTVGPFYEGTDYAEGWRLATELGVPMVDEHYYVDPGWMIHNQDYYDRYDRTNPRSIWRICRPPARTSQQHRDSVGRSSLSDFGGT